MLHTKHDTIMKCHSPIGCVVKFILRIFLFRETDLSQRFSDVDSSQPNIQGLAVSQCIEKLFDHHVVGQSLPKTHRTGEIGSSHQPFEITCMLLLNLNTTNKCIHFQPRVVVQKGVRETGAEGQWQGVRRGQRDTQRGTERDRTNDSL